MSFVSTRSRYGLRFLVELCRRQGSGPVDLASIAEQQEMPERYLAKLAAALRNAGLVRSERGAGGGFKLARPADSICIRDVVEALDGRISLVECTGDSALCPRSGACPTLPIWKGLESLIRDYLEGITLEALSKPREIDYSI
jgi:Rrf2 family protein